MNVALIHDKYSIKNFWEQKIENHCHVTEDEETRMKNSALSKLRSEWIKRLESRTKHLKNVNEESIRKGRLQQADSA